MTVAHDSLTILIVEDDEDARNSLCDILELDQHQVTAVGTLAEAMSYGDWDDLDVILLDRKLSDGRAEDILPELRKVAPQADVIVITGFTDLDGTITALRYGVSDYVIKPLNPDVLRNGLQRTARRRQIERRLREQREFAEKILATAEALVLVVDLEGRVVRFNPYLEQLTGDRCPDLIGANWFEIFVPPEDREQAREAFERSIQHRELRGIVYSIQTPQGRKFHIRWSNTTLKNDAGQTTAMLCIGLDITDLVMTQQQLVQAERLAAIGETVAGLAHESRNALQRIRSGIEVLELTCEDDPEVLRDLRRIDKAADDLRALLDEVRSFAAPIVLERQLVDLRRLWGRSWEQLRQSHKDRQLVLEEDVSETPLPIYGDERKLESVFWNLFQNAVECTPDPVRIVVKCRQTVSGTEIWIGDNGPGLSREQAQKVFRAFYTTKATGTGLGLAICRRIMEAHHGSIDVELSDRQGACFRLFLPRNGHEK